MKKGFDPGDRVIANTHKGRISHVYYNRNGNKMCNVVFDDKKLMPSEMEFPEYKLKHEPEDNDWSYGRGYNSYRDPAKWCPKCGTKWTETKFGNQIWYDCNKCKKKKEDIIN